MLTHLMIMAAAAAAPLTDPAPAEPVVAASPPVPQPVSQPVSEAMAEAIANKARKKRDPSVKKEAPLDYPDSEKASGNGGRVYIRGIIGTDGRLTEAVVVRTNASPVLTASALKAATDTEFHPAKDAAGAPISVVATLPIEFVFEDIRADTVSYVEPVFGDAERAAGLTGTVTVGGLMNTEGRLVDAKVLVSSRSPELDAAAMTAAQATVYRVDRDGDGKPLEASFRRSYEFYSYKAKGGKGILTYTCGQFARDQI